MGIPSDDIARSEYRLYVEQFLADTARGAASEVQFRPEGKEYRTWELIDGNFRKGPMIKSEDFALFREILKKEIFAGTSFRFTAKKHLCLIEMSEENDGTVCLTIVRRPVANGRTDALEDVFRAFEHPSWEAVKSIFISILNLALAQGYDKIIMELNGHTVDVKYRNGIQRGTILTISSDSYDALVRLINDNYFAFGFMMKKFRDTEYLIRLNEIDEENVSPKITLEIEKLD
ncbi:MAG TPA: hypothetical protein VGB30_00965 [bacterium]|jgi:hypothetical protein